MSKTMPQTLDQYWSTLVNHSVTRYLFWVLDFQDGCDDYIEQLIPTTQPIPKIKMKVFGDSGVGKTTLIESMRAGYFSGLFRRSKRNSGSKKGTGFYPSSGFVGAYDYFSKTGYIYHAHVHSLSHKFVLTHTLSHTHKSRVCTTHRHTMVFKAIFMALVASLMHLFTMCWLFQWVHKAYAAVTRHLKLS